MYQDAVSRYVAQGYSQKQVDEAIKKQYAGNTTVISNVDSFSKNNNFMKVAGTNEVISKARADEINKNLEEGLKYSPEKFSTKEAFLAAYGNNKSTAELAYLNAYYDKSAKAKTAGLTASVADVTEIAADNKTVEFKDAIKDEALANEKKFTALTDEEVDKANKMFSDLANMDTEFSAEYEEMKASLNEAAQESQNVYNQIKSFADKQYSMALDELAKRKAGMSSGVASKLSGSGVSSATIANAMAEIRNNPQYAKEENDVTNNYVTSLQNAINSFTNIQNTLNNSKASNTANALALKQYIATQKDKLNESISTIKKEGIKAIYDPAINAEAAIRAKTQEEEVKYSANEAEASNYRNSNTEMRKNTLWDKLYSADNSIDRGKIPSDVWDKAAAMDSLVDARIYLNNYLKNNATTTGGTNTGGGTTSTASTSTTKTTPTTKTSTTTPTGKTETGGGTTTPTTKPTATTTTTPVKGAVKPTTQTGTVDKLVKSILDTMPIDTEFYAFNARLNSIKRELEKRNAISPTEQAIIDAYLTPGTAQLIYQKWQKKK